MPILMPMASHDQKSHVALHFDHLDLRNAMVLLTMLSTSHDADIIAVESYDQSVPPIPFTGTLGHEHFSIVFSNAPSSLHHLC